MVPWINKTTIVMVGFLFVSGFFHLASVHAESKSEMIKRLRNKSCTEDVQRTLGQLAQLKQFQANITGFLQSINSSTPHEIAASAQSTENAVIGLSTALSNHSRAKKAICDRLQPDSKPATGDYPEGYQGLSKSERIHRLKSEYCADVSINGGVIRNKIPALKSSMTKMIKELSRKGASSPPAQQLRQSWGQLLPLTNDLSREYLAATDICHRLSQGISKSELIRKSKQGLESGGQIPHFWYIIKYD